MSTKITIYSDTDQHTARQLDRIEEALNRLEGNVEEMTLDINVLEQEATANTDAITAIEVLISKFGQAVLDEGPNQARINAVVKKMVDNRTRLATAALAGTPAAPVS